LPDKKKGYVHYSALAVQIVGTILIFVYIGQWLDEKYSLETPWFTLGLSVLGLMGSMIYLIRKA
jgi:F0F1-type ATP synthase assembly protein I